LPFASSDAAGNTLVYACSMRLLCLVLVLVGCGDGAPSCKDALDKAARTLGDHASRTIQEMTAVCERTGWTAEQRRCVANARDELAVGMCVAGAVISTATKASQEQAAVKQAAEAKQEALERARGKLERVQDQLTKTAKNIDEFDDRLGKAESALLQARNDADRAAVKAQLAALRKEKAELDARLVAAEAEVDEAARAMNQALEAMRR
jgi:DNA repair exonuclease SbcCD ATPase subunit